MYDAPLGLVWTVVGGVVRYGVQLALVFAL
jgi:hypothetical protein